MAFTFFFRDTHTLNQTADHLIPAVAGRSRIRIWDAGCANGPEPYTFAIILAEKMGKFSFNNVTIESTDIDEGKNFGEIIKEGVYNWEEVGRIPEDLLAKYFRKSDGEDKYALVDSIKDRIRYQTHDLLTLQSVGSDFSLIICKNVLLHFQYEQRIQVIKMFYHSLAPDGLFIMEQTQKMPTEINHLFEQVVSDAQLFRKISH